MKGIRVIAVGLLLLGTLPLLGAAAKTAPKAAPKDELPPNTVGSGVIRISELGDLQNLSFVVKAPNDDPKKDAVIVRTILPKGWTYEQVGIKKGTNELDPKLGSLTMLAKPPIKGETDFVYQLDIITKNLSQGLDLKDKSGKPIVWPEKDKTPQKMFQLYLNWVIGDMLKRGYKSDTRQADVKPIPYGTVPDEKTGKLMMMGSRPAPMYFVPLSFTHKDKGDQVVMFVGSVGEKLVSMRFFVAKDQMEFYDSTVVMLVNNTWGLTVEQEEQWRVEYAERMQKLEKQAVKPKAGRPNSKTKN
jgi:hypothetical protein